MSNNNQNYLEVQKAFDALMSELENFRDLNSIADSHRRNAADLFEKIQAHYSMSREEFERLFKKLDSEREEFKKSTLTMTSEISRRVENLARVENTFSSKVNDIEALLLRGQRRQTTLVAALSVIAICLLGVIIFLLCR